MNGSDIMSELFKNQGKHAVFFDDQKIGSFLYGNEQNELPTPAEVLSFWLQGGEMTQAMEQSLASVITGKIKLVLDLGRGEEVSDLLKKVIARSDRDVIARIRSLVGLFELSKTIDPHYARLTYKTVNELIVQFMEKLDEETKKRWDRVRWLNGRFYTHDIPVSDISEEGKVVTNGPEIFEDYNPENGYSLRSQAFDKFLNKDFSGAAEIYLRMIDMMFELPGTFCHLARVQLLMHQEKEAFTSANRAGILKAKAPNYVVPRIILLKIFFAMLYGMKFNKWINRLHSYMNNNPDLEQWDIQTVIIEYREMLQCEHYRFLMTFADVLASEEKPAIFEQFEFWPKEKGRFTSDEDASS